jgi:hypothetical protein
LNPNDAITAPAAFSLQSHRLVDLEWHADPAQANSIGGYIEGVHRLKEGPVGIVHADKADRLPAVDARLASLAHDRTPEAFKVGL